MGVICPIDKNNGPSDDPNNYRGITLLSSMGKLFTSCLNKRLTDYVESEKLLSETQAYSTLDHKE